jgi:hypothetical protein
VRKNNNRRLQRRSKAKQTRNLQAQRTKGYKAQSPETDKHPRPMCRTDATILGFLDRGHWGCWGTPKATQGTQPSSLHQVMCGMQPLHATYRDDNFGSLLISLSEVHTLCLIGNLPCQGMTPDLATVQTATHKHFAGPSGGSSHRAQCSSIDLPRF